MTLIERGISLKVLLFARYADLLGAPTVTVRLPEGATVRDAVDAVRALPGGAAIPPRPVCAINLETAELDTTLAPQDELALLPPVAGG